MSTLWLSNRYEVLAERLVEAVGGARASLFDAESVIVPSAAVQRDLALRIAARHGVCAQVEFGFLAQWVWRRIAQRLPEVGAASPFAPGALGWRLFRLLGEAAREPAALGSPRLAAWLAGADAPMRLGLAERLAGLFDHYLTYRSDWLARWGAGESAAEAGTDAAWRADEAWQAALWRRLLAELGLSGDAHPARRFLEALAADEAAGRPAPAAPVHVFALPAIPPLYLAVLQRLARHEDLRLYLLNPCREYWFDLVDARRLARLALRGRAGHAEVGQPLLAAWGTQTQDQLALLFDETEPAFEDHADYRDAAGDGPPGRPPRLLAQLQDAVLDARPLPPGSLRLAPDDASLSLQVCHSLTRELEVLHDRLLDLFAEPAAPGRPALQPHEVLVVVPDLAAAAPLIDAVFGTAPPARQIPFAITGRPRRAVNRCARALHDLLALLAGPCPASALFELLQQPAVARRQGLDDADLARLHDWFAEAGFRWGLAPAQSAIATGSGSGSDEDADTDPAPATLHHSLDDALDRLFLAHALPPGLGQAYAGRLPAGEVEGADAAVLGLLWRFARQLRAWQPQLAAARPAPQWLALLLEVLDGLLRPLDEEREELRELQARLREWTAQMQEGLGDTPLEAAVLRRALEGLLEEPTRGGVPTGRVSFAAPGSLRGLPFRVVAFLGLDDRAYPGSTRPAEFDLMAQRPRRGDRQRRQDERNTFLDLLLAARERLILSHSGRSARDNAPRPPSVLVGELFDVLLPALQGAETPAGRAALRARLVAEHPLQPFSPRAFEHGGDPRLRSHQAEYVRALLAARETAAAAAAGGEAAWADELAAARGEAAGEDVPPADDPDDDRGGPGGPAPRFFARPLPPPGPAWRAPDLATLARFFRHPARALLEQRLRLALPQADAALRDDEAFGPEDEARQALAHHLLPAALAGADTAALQALAQALPGQPDGRLGAAWRADELPRLLRHARRLAPRLASPALPPQRVDWAFEVDGEPWCLQAVLAGLRPDGLLHHAYRAPRVGDRLDAWLWHLALCAAAPPGVAPVSRWIGRDAAFRLEPCADAADQLQTLLGLYRRGLQAPLPFFPRASWACAEAGGGARGQAAALGKWVVDARRPHGESGHPALRLALRGIAQPLGADFEALAMAVFDPLRAHLVDDDGAAAPAPGDAAARPEVAR
ncbi:exodeoxyribonuclease V subunit gamma [Piscinibacter sakaiensis]|uniref:RecBCD enzyme subunit RecC n=1 Tax=Piscinibacter sakaiensis TaxID=1547922 RepID=A0A0K8NXV3_PISS1|nr:exodeoxyribonuclease V subunit gamma [Piscinibacter sakaiensis]GAP35232.1 exodeoxyribonuclease V, gamma chain [Piscinibacter sakaiensis]